MKRTNFLVLLLAIMVAIFAFTGCKKSDAAKTEGTKLSLGSWRVDDVKQVNKLLAAFTKANPDITVEFKPTNPPEYNAVLRTQLEGETAPDLFYVRSFSVTRGLYNEGFLEPLEGLEGLDNNFTKANISPWATDEGVPYAVPFMAVSHGVYYNVNLFNELGISIPNTWEELIAAAEKIKAAGYVPFANGSKDEWDMNEIVMMNLLPSFIGGRKARLQYERGERPFNDAEMVAAFGALKDIAPYLPKGQEAVSYYDSQQLFLQGQAAMFFGGSWDIAMFEAESVEFEWSVFATPAPAGKDTIVCFHADAGIALNKASKNKEAAKKFLIWLTTTEAGELLTNEIPGFFSLNKNDLDVNNKHSKEFLNLNKGRGTDVRFVWPVLLDGQPDGYSLMQTASIAVVKGTMTPQEAADHLHKGLSQWIKPKN